MAVGHIEFQDGHLEPIAIPYLLAVPEMTLRLLGLSVSLMALGWLVARLEVLLRYTCGGPSSYETCTMA